MPATTLCMFALMPPPELSKIIDNLRHEIAENFGCQKALKPPVHITLFPPFSATVDEITALKKLTNWTAHQQPIHIPLNGFNTFDNSPHPVFYIHVERSNQFRDFQTHLSTRIKAVLPQLNDPFSTASTPYHPHITLAYRDTTKEMITAIKHAYRIRPFSHAFTAEACYLWQHDGTQWQVAHTYPLTGQPDGGQVSLF